MLARTDEQVDEIVRILKLKRIPVELIHVICDLAEVWYCKKTRIDKLFETWDIDKAFYFALPTNLKKQGLKCTKIAVEVSCIPKNGWAVSTIVCRDKKDELPDLEKEMEDGKFIWNESDMNLNSVLHLNTGLWVHCQAANALHDASLTVYYK